MHLTSIVNIQWRICMHMYLYKTPITETTKCLMKNPLCLLSSNIIGATLHLNLVIALCLVHKSTVCKPQIVWDRLHFSPGEELLPKRSRVFTHTLLWCAPTMPSFYDFYMAQRALTWTWFILMVNWKAIPRFMIICCYCG